MEDIHSATNTPWYKTKGSQITLKLIMIMGLIIFLLIPKFSILALIEERGHYYDQVNDEVSVGWGGRQVLTAPVLAIPYQTITKNQDGTSFATETYLVVVPESCDIEGTMDTTKKYRSIYEVLLYKSKNHFKGNFDLTDIVDNGIPVEMLKLNEAFIAVGVSDLKGLESKVDMTINGLKYATKAGMQKLQFQYRTTNENGTDKVESMRNGLFIPYPISSNTKSLTFDFALNCKGGQKISFLPTSQNLKVHITSAFPHPIFGGSFLPDHTTNANGFDAKWSLLEYNKNLPKYNKDAQLFDIGEGSFSIAIKPLQNHYQSTYRAGKYMILVIVLTFLVVFLTEIIQQHRVHIFQYSLIGFSIALFFVLLLSFSEVIGFTKSYLLATAATTGLTFLYGISVFKNIKSTLCVVALQLCIYGFIYTILRMEEASLLVGSIGLFVILAATMWMTRKIKWYESE